MSEEGGLRPLGCGTVAASTFRGEQVVLRVEVGPLQLLASARSGGAPRPGDRVAVGVCPDGMWLIPGADPDWLGAG
jgi:hypothetical protein